LPAQATRLAKVPAAPLSKRELDAWRGFLRTHARLWRELEANLEAAHGISLGAFDVLVLLDESPGDRRRMTELADAVLMTSGGFTRLADRLCADGLVARERSPSDGRGFELVLTDAGRAKLEQARTTHRADIRRRFLAPLSAEEQSALGAIWERLQATGSE
jgi:DNA-binding MarR family transcriptional regulator